MKNSKHPAASLGLQGSIVVLLGFLLDQFGYHISESELVSLISAVFVLGGAVMAFVGRWRAKHQIKA